MNTKRINIGQIRREQIVGAAIAVIAQKGLQHCSLSEIEKKVGMSRGQLMYYFKTKEEILLAVFDRLLEMMCEQQCMEHEGDCLLNWQELFRKVLNMVMQNPPAHPEFHALQYTFLSQIGHRADFRGRLAKLYEDWRMEICQDLEKDFQARPPVRRVNPRAFAAVIQAILHGLAMQSAADPKALEIDEMVELCMEMVGSYLWPSPGISPVKNNSPAKIQKKTSRSRRSSSNGVHP